MKSAAHVQVTIPFRLILTFECFPVLDTEREDVFNALQLCKLHKNEVLFLCNLTLVFLLTIFISGIKIITVIFKNPRIYYDHSVFAGFIFHVLIIGFFWFTRGDPP